MQHIYGDYVLEARLIKTKDNEQISLLNIIDKQSQEQERPNESEIVTAAKTKQPIVLMHGSYSNRHFWLSVKGKGLAGYLYDQGYDIWIMEFRGHGLSPKSRGFTHYNAQDWGEYDIPAVHAYIKQQTQQKVFFIGHSSGGVNCLVGLSLSAIDTKAIQGLVLLGAQTTHGQEFLKVFSVYQGIKLLVTVFKRFPAKLLNYGPEDESPAYILQMVNWRRKGLWMTSQGEDVWQGLRMEFPLLMITSEGDQQDPKQGVIKVFNNSEAVDKQLVILGVQHGDQKDYSHTGMVIDKQAQQDVWSKINCWLKEKS